MFWTPELWRITAPLRRARTVLRRLRWSAGGYAPTQGLHFVLHNSVEGRATTAVQVKVARPVETGYSLAIPFSYRPPDPVPTPRLAVLCHIFYPDLAAEIRQYISNIPFPFDFFVSTDTPSKQVAIQRQFSDWTSGSVDVRLVEN